MKQPYFGLFSGRTLKNNYLSVVAAAVLLCFSLTISAQTFDPTRKLQPVNGDGFIWKSGEFVGKMKAPSGLAPLTSKDSGSMAFANGSMNVWNGTTWAKIGTGDGGTTVVTGAPDSTYARFINPTGKNYRIVAVGVTGGTTVSGGSSGSAITGSTIEYDTQNLDSVTGYVTPFQFAQFKNNINGAFDSTAIYGAIGKKLDTTAVSGFITTNNTVGIQNKSISGLQNNLSDIPATAVKTSDVQPLTSSGTGAPATIPAFIGLIYIDTAAAKVYISTGTTSSTDWKILN